MEVTDMSWEDTKNKRCNNPLLPKSIRGLIVGKSNCGKTTLLLNLLLKPGWLDFNNLQVFGKSIFQFEYDILKKAFEKKLPKEKVIELFDNKDKIKSYNIPPLDLMEDIGKTLVHDTSPTINCKFYKSSDDIPDPSDLNPEQKNLMIFDDVLLEKQNKCEAYYTRGRHSNIDCFYLSQNFFRLPRQTIRENANLICLFPQDDKNISHIYSDYVSRDMSYKEFKKLCKTVWSKPYGFIVIDLSSTKDNGKYRSGFNHFYFPDMDESLEPEDIPVVRIPLSSSVQLA